MTNNINLKVPVQESEKIAVIGGGPVGSMQAILLARRGFQVELYEARKDIRKVKPGRGRSINLTLSHRGRESLKAIGCEESALAEAIPVHARYIHQANGEISIQPYGTEPGEAIWSVDRQKLNELLLSKAEQYENIRLNFEHKLIRSDLKSKTHTFSTPNQNNMDIKYQFTFGSDGAHSTVRQQLISGCRGRARFDYSQKYIEHGYKELKIPPNSDNNYAMPHDFLHIWPRNEFMLLALPNMDKSFTLTLFMPFTVFDMIKTNQDLIQFFEKYFPDTIDKIGRDNLINDFFANPPGQLLSVKCSPYYLGPDSSVILIGDAAHAVVPFYGQGLNMGLEDCLVFDEFMTECGSDLHLSAVKYSEKRWKDGHGIADLSLENYLELRSHVNSRWFIIRRHLDYLLHRVFPNTFIPLYKMVVFTRMPLHEAIEHKHWQKKAIQFASILMLVGVVLLCVCAYRLLIC